MNLLPIAQYIEDAGFGVQGENIFINMIPAERPVCIMVRNKLQGTLIDYELPGFYKTRFQLIVRAGDYVTGDKLISEVCDALTLTERQIGDMFVRYMRPVTMPVVFPLSKGNLLEFTNDFDIAFNK